MATNKTPKPHLSLRHEGCGRNMRLFLMNEGKGRIFYSSEPMKGHERLGDNESDDAAQGEIGVVGATALLNVTCGCLFRMKSGYNHLNAIVDVVGGSNNEHIIAEHDNSQVMWLRFVDKFTYNIHRSDRYAFTVAGATRLRALANFLSYFIETNTETKAK